MRVAIVGCGTAGAAAAVLLHDLGHHVRVLERFERPSPVGAGLLLQPTGMGVLRGMGLLDRVLARGARVDRLFGTTRRGRAVLDVAYADWRPGAFGLGVHRTILFDALWEALRSRGVPVETGRAVRSARELDADLVLACDGARSALRAGTAAVRRARPYPWGALWAVVDDPEERYAGVLRQVYRGTREMLGFLPSGRPDGSPARVSVFWSLPAADLERTRAAGLAALAARIRALTPLAEPVLAQLRSFDDLIWASYMDVVLRSPVAGRVAFLGDAAHAMSPQLGQGANLALMDAWVLAGAVREHGDDMGAALAAYAERRRAHVRFYGWASRLLTPVFQSHLRVIGPPRDALAGPLGRVPAVRDQALASLAGGKTGLLRGELSADGAGP